MIQAIIPVATTQVDPRERSAFSAACLDDLERQLNERELPVTYEYRNSSVAGRTLVGSAHRDGNCLLIVAELSPPWWSDEALSRVLEAGIGGGCAGRVLKTSDLYGIHVIERIEISEVTLLQLHTGVANRRVLRVP